MRIIIEDESCDILNKAELLLELIKNDYLATSAKSIDNKQQKVANRIGQGLSLTDRRKSGSTLNGIDSKENYKRPKTPLDCVRIICDEVVQDSIRSCRELDYKMELAKLLSGEAKIELYIEQGNLSSAQRLACNMNRPDYVSTIIEEAAKLNQNHVKTVCQLWLAKHETRNFIR